MGGIYLLTLKRSTSRLINNQTLLIPNQKPIHTPCLAGDEFAEYDRVSQHPVVTQPKEISPTILVSNKNTKEITTSLRLDNVRNSVHPIEVHECGIYFIRESNYNFQKHTQEAGYREEIWKYDYEGQKKLLILLAEDSKEYVSYYSTDFSVDPKENFMSLIRGYGGRDDYALAIKDLKTLKDALVLPVADILKQNPDVAGDVGFESGGWSSDGRYFWFTFNQLADIVGFVRVDSSDWSYNIFPAPQRTMGGDAFNRETGMVTYGENVAPWTGSEEIDQQLKDEAVQNGQISSFYIYNLFTKQKYLIATTTDPTYFFRPFWVSDYELQYELPDGTKKIYKINK